MNSVVFQEVRIIRGRPRVDFHMNLFFSPSDLHSELLCLNAA